MPKITRAAFAKYGFSSADLLTEWRDIVGSDLAVYTIPEKLKWPRNQPNYDEDPGLKKRRTGATLVMRVDPARALDVQYSHAQIIDRINAYFGYQAISELRLKQAPVAETEALAITRVGPRQSSDPADIAAIDDLNSIKDDRLREALNRMAKNIRNDRKQD